MCVSVASESRIKLLSVICYFSMLKGIGISLIHKTQHLEVIRGTILCFTA